MSKRELRSSGKPRRGDSWQ